MTEIKKITGYEDLTREQLIKVAVDLRERNYKITSELNSLKNRLCVWERKTIEGITRDIKDGVSDVIDPIEFKCSGCGQYISPIRATTIYKDKPFCHDCYSAKKAEDEWGKQPETRPIVDYSSEK